LFDDAFGQSQDVASVVIISPLTERISQFRTIDGSWNILKGEKSMTLNRQVLTILAAALLVGSAQGQNVKSFCEYGHGATSQIDAGGAVWNHTWGQKKWGWYDCEDTPNTGILNKNVTSVLQTQAKDTPPSMDEDMILRLEYGGTLTITAWDEEESNGIAGQIVGDVDCIFVVDMAAERAVVDEQTGTITIVFGSELHDDTDALITVVETTGKFSNVYAEGAWRWHASGTVTLALVPELDLQTNIMAALDPQWFCTV
jgi:hypothetical protein